MKSYEELARYKKRTITFGVIGIAVIAFAAWYLIHASVNLFFQIKGRDLSRISSSLARQINAENHATIRTTEDMSLTNYQTVTTALENCQRDYPEIVSAYTMRITDGKGFLIVSPPADYNRDGKIEGEMEARDNVGTPYFHEPSPAMLGAARGKTTYDTEFTIDNWGTWLTACSPLKTFTGNTDNIVCVDEDGAAVLKALNHQKLTVGALSLIIALVFIGILIEFISTKIELKTSKIASDQQESALMHIVTAIEQTSLVAIQSFDANGIVRSWNRASEEIFGVPASEAIGSDMVSVMSRATGTPMTKTDIETVLRSRKPTPIREENIANSEGEARRILSTLSPIIEAGEVVEVVYIGVNATKV